jgi:integrase
MARKIAPLTDQQCKSTPPGESKQGKRLFDGGGLYLEIKPTARIWRMKYSFGGKEKLLTFGRYPQVGLGRARKLREEAKALLAQDIDPSQHKQEQQAKKAALEANTFELVAREWYAHWKDSVTERHASYTINRLEKDVFPILGGEPIGEITAPMVLQVLRKVEARKAVEIAHRLKQAIGQVMRYGVHTGRLESDPTRDLQGALKNRPQGHYPSISIDELPELLKAMQDPKYRLFPLTRLALHLMLFTFVRTSELMGARWDEFNFEKALWTVPPERMKMRRAHTVPLSTEALEVLQEIRTYSHYSPLLFPNMRGGTGHMSNESLNRALELMGFKGRMSGHGFRSLATGVLIEKLGYRYDLIDMQLAHQKGKIESAYRRTSQLGDRKEMLQKYADYLALLT